LTSNSNTIDTKIVHFSLYLLSINYCVVIQISDISDRANFSEHACSKKTEYQTIVRVVTRQFPNNPPDSAQQGHKLTYKTFTTAPLVDIHSFPPIEVTETCFEDLRSAVGKIAKWIISSGITNSISIAYTVVVDKYN